MSLISEYGGCGARGARIFSASLEREDSRSSTGSNNNGAEYRIVAVPFAGIVNGLRVFVKDLDLALYFVSDNSLMWVKTRL